jgi:outer membrane protein assembly factor BamA
MRALLWLFLLIAPCMLPAQTDTIVKAPSAPPPPVRIHSVVITGNRVTRDRIILRELTFQEGDTISLTDLYDRLERSRQNLNNTSLFNSVAVLPVYLDLQTVLIEIQVNERWYLWPSVTFKLADPNFNTWWQTRDLGRINYGVYLYKYNFRGQNETIYVMTQFGYANKYSFRYKVPYIDKKQRWGMSIGGSLLEQEEVTVATIGNERLLVRDPHDFNREEKLADVEFTLRPSHDDRHYWRSSFTRATIADTIAHSAEEYFTGDATVTRFLTLGYSFVHDTRDLRIFPSKGEFIELAVDRYGLGLLDIASPDITTLKATGVKWFRPASWMNAAVSLRGKATFGRPPYYVQEGLGYTVYARGYEYYVVDGEHYALGRLNLMFPIFKPKTVRLEKIPVEHFRTLYFALYLNLYSDAGYVWDSRYADRNPLANEWLNGHGAGLDLVTSYDQIIRLEYSLNGLGEHGFFLHFTQPF